MWPHGVKRENFTFLTHTLSCTVKIKPALKQTKKAQRGSRGTALLFI
jgi:hypothetical protein